MVWSPRFIPAGSLIEITARTVGARFLLRPSAALNARILATLGRALALQPVDLHAISFMSNHWHALASVADALALSRFVQHVHSNVARAVNALHGWDGPVFRRASLILVGPDAEDIRLRYVLAQGAKEGLVRSSLDWPGVHSARALLYREVLVGVWQHRQREHQLRVGGGNGGGRAASPNELQTVYPIDLKPMPSWAGLDVGQRIVRVREMLDDIERAATLAHPRPLGVAAVLAQDPLARPRQSKRSPAPRIHTSDEATRADFTMQELEFCDVLFTARQLLRKERPTVLPAGCFPPQAPFHASPAMLWSAANRATSITRTTPDNCERTTIVADE